MSTRVQTIALFGLLSAAAVGQPPIRPVWIAGSVVLSEGTSPPMPVLIEMVCRGQTFPQGRTDRGSFFAFSIEPGRYLAPFHASQRGPAPSTFFDDRDDGQQEPDAVRQEPDDWGQDVGDWQQQFPDPDDLLLAGCYLRAVLDGYVSSEIELSSRTAGGIVTLVLTRSTGHVPETISVTSLKAPAKARRAYEKALKQIGRRDYANAARQLTRAVRLYPDYADAWYQLGVARQALGEIEEARKCFEKGLVNDGKPVKQRVP